MDPTAVDPVNAVDKAKQAKDIQEDLDSSKQEQMDELQGVGRQP